MSLRTLFILILTVTLGASFFWMNDLIQSLILVSPDPETKKVSLVAEQWAIVLTLWPISLLGALITGTLALLFIGYTYGIVGDIDTKAKLEAMKKQTERQIEKTKTDIEEKAGNAQALYDKALQIQAENKAQVTKVNAFINQAETEKQAALASEAETIKKNQRMFHRIERLKKKIAKLEH